MHIFFVKNGSKGTRICPKCSQSDPKVSPKWLPSYPRVTKAILLYPKWLPKTPKWCQSYPKAYQSNFHIPKVSSMWLQSDPKVSANSFTSLIESLKSIGKNVCFSKTDLHIHKVIAKWPQSDPKAFSYTKKWSKEWLRGALGPLGSHFGFTLGSLWGHFGVTWGAFWAYDGGFGSYMVT